MCVHVSLCFVLCVVAGRVLWFKKRNQLNELARLSRKAIYEQDIGSSPRMPRSGEQGMRGEQPLPVPTSHS